MLARYIHTREIKHAARDTNRIVTPYAWGLEHLDPAFMDARDGDETLLPPRSPQEILRAYAQNAVRRSDEFYALPPVTDYRLDADNRLTWTSAIPTPTPSNNTAAAKYLPASLEKRKKHKRPSSAVVILPNWNAPPDGHISLGTLLNRFGISALRLTLPYHEERNAAGHERADFLVCSNLGRSLQSMRQAALDARAAVAWLAVQGYERIGVMGTSIGSCAGFLAFVHDERIKMGVFNHVSGYFSDVVWQGISTKHVRAGFGDAVTLEEVRAFWLPTSPTAFLDKLQKLPPRPMRFIAARYDLTFPADLSHEVIHAVREKGIPLSVAWLPCGHYTSGEKPWVYLDGWKILSFIRRHL